MCKYTPAGPWHVQGMLCYSKTHSRLLILNCLVIALTSTYVKRMKRKFETVINAIPVSCIWLSYVKAIATTMVLSFEALHSGTLCLRSTLRQFEGLMIRPIF